MRKKDKPKLKLFVFVPVGWENTNWVNAKMGVAENMEAAMSQAQLTIGDWEAFELTKGKCVLVEGSGG